MIGHHVRTIPAPFNPLISVTIRRLSARQKGRARDIAMAALVRDFLRDPIPVLEELQSIPPDHPMLDEVRRDPLNMLDPRTVIRFGVVRWSEPADVAGLKPDEIEALAREIAAL